MKAEGSTNPKVCTYSSDLGLNAQLFGTLGIAKWLERLSQNQKELDSSHAKRRENKLLTQFLALTAPVSIRLRRSIK